jgi:hypothetical protein
MSVMVVYFTATLESIAACAESVANLFVMIGCVAINQTHTCNTT